MKTKMTEQHYNVLALASSHNVEQSWL